MSRYGGAWADILLPGKPVGEEAGPLPADRFRFLFLSGVILVMALMILARLAYLQVYTEEDYGALATGNRIRYEVEYAPRGRILDRDGRVLADNTLSFQISMVPYMLPRDPVERERVFSTVSAVAGRPVGELEKLYRERGEDYVLPVAVADRLTHEQALRFETREPELDGFSLDEVPSRVYDASAGLAHVIGYTGRVSPEDLEAHPEGLLPTDVIGKVGVEYTMDDRLRGRNGHRRIEVDALGRPVRVLDEREAVPGRDLTLSIDYDTQKALYDAIGAQLPKAGSKRGSGYAVNPVTGEVLAVVSNPGYDNNLFARGITTAEYEGLLNHPLNPLYNQAVSGGFTSGSVIKPMVAAAALQEGVVNEHTVIVDTGALSIASVYDPSVVYTFRGWRPSGLGPMNARSAIAWSSNIYFYTVGGGYRSQQGLGVDRLTRYYRLFGLGEQSGIDLTNELEGRVPDPGWKKEVKGEDWFIGDTYNISIGQGDLVISPLQIAMAHAAIANDGYLLRPQLVKEGEREVRREIPVDKRHLQVVREGMRQVLTDGTTCECVFKDVPHQVAGKSGTAETNTPDGRRPHAWYSAYAPYGAPRILAAVIIEEGSGGSQFAAPAIAEAMKAYFATEGR